MKEAYDGICEELGWRPRYFIQELFRRLDEALDERTGTLFLVDLPAGYGKSLATTLTLARLAIEGNAYFSRVIHVLPMRSIIDDLYRRLQEHLGRINPGFAKAVAAQYMLTPGSPLFVKRCVVTTLDTFVLNFFKLPAHEIHKIFEHNTAHFEFPRGMIYTSLVVLDEFHLFTGLGTIREESKTLTAVLAVLECLLGAGIPVIVMTATMPAQIKDMVKETASLMGSRLEELEYKRGFDLEFDRLLEEKERKLKRTEVPPLDDIGQANRVALVFNTVDRAIEWYRRLKERYPSPQPKLIHGRLPQSRRGFLEEISKSDHYLIVATQVIEAGVDLDFDLMITECCPPDRLVQRAGRVARKGGAGEIWVVRAGEAQPYRKELIDLTWAKLESIDKLDYRVEKELITEVYSKADRPRPLETLWRALKDIDSSLFVGLHNAKEAFEYFNGFTDSAGLISVFCEGDYDPRNAIALSADDIRGELLRPRSKVRFLVDLKGTLEEASEEDLKRERLSIFMLRRGYKGLVIDKESYQRLMGLDST